MNAGEKGIPIQGILLVGFTVVFCMASEGLTDKVRHLS